MLFKTTELPDEFLGLHPALRSIVHDLDDYISERGLPSLMLTHALRTPEQQEEFYWLHYLRLSPTLTEAAAREKARRRFSWHLCSCAVDFRNRDYDEDELASIRRWLTDKCKKPLWEVISHDVGRGEHFHLGIQDFLWRRKYERDTGPRGAA